MITIFSPSTSNRLQYTFELIFKLLIQWDYTIVTSKEQFLSAKGPKFSYSKARFEGEVFFYSTEILHETEVSKKQIQVVSKDDRTAFFVHNMKDSRWPYDPFAMVFYLVSRYEEYFDSEQDRHGRYRSSNSLAVRYRFIDKPVINIIAEDLANIFIESFPELIYRKPDFSFQPTFDIDYAWSYQNKGVMRNLGAMSKDLLSGKISHVGNRLNVLKGSTKDPFDNYDLIDTLHSGISTAPIFFFLVGAHGKFDKNISIQNPNFQELIKRIANRYTVGLHPSYKANFNKKLINKEREALEDVTEKKVQCSRHHYLRIDIPKTYRVLESIGLTDDYSMGYSDVSGFRASIATPFKWFDLEEDRISDLTIHPFEVMDVTLKDQLQLSPAAASEEITNIISAISKVGGNFTSIWHNNSFDFEGEWEGWEDVYRDLLKEVIDQSGKASS